MKKTVVFLCRFAAVILSISGCADSAGNKKAETTGKEIEAIKGMTVRLFDLSGEVGAGVVKMAGIDGTVEWSTFKPEKYKDNANISGVEAVVKGKGIKQGKATHRNVPVFT